MIDGVFIIELIDTVYHYNLARLIYLWMLLAQPTLNFQLIQSIAYEYKYKLFCILCPMTTSIVSGLHY